MPEVLTETEPNDSIEVVYYVPGLDCIRCENPIPQPPTGAEHITALCDECIARQFVASNAKEGS